MPESSPPAAIVTGTASGIGRAFAGRLASLGYRLLLVDRDHAGLLTLEAELAAAPRAASHPAADHELIVADVGDADAWRGLGETLSHDGADVALLVQCAGTLVAGRLADCEPAALEGLVRTNLTGVLLGCQATIPLLARRAAEPAPLPRGVLNVASIFATVAPPGFAAYNAAKAGVVTLTETLHGELAPLGLSATVVLPGVTPTRLFDRAEFFTGRLRGVVDRYVAEAELTPAVVADAALDAYRARRPVATIGRRARRYDWLKRWLPSVLRRRVTKQANRALDGGEPTS